MEKYRRFILLIDYNGEEGKLNEDAAIVVEIYNELFERGDYVFKKQPSKGTHFAVDISIESGTPLSVAAKQARDFVIYHRDTEVKDRLTEDEYDDLIFTLDSISN